MRESTNEERRARTKARAWWLAMSGLFNNSQEVEARLVEEGVADAARWLDEDFRKRMDATCVQAKNAGPR